MNVIRVAVLMMCLSSPSYARGGGGHSSGGYRNSGGHHSNSYGSGTGSNPSSTHVSGYSKKNGTYVAPHNRSSKDGNFNNNWSTKPNTNPSTGEEGKKVSPPNE